MGSELFALKEMCRAVQWRFPHHSFQLNVVGACDQRPCCLEFLQKNHQPQHLTMEIQREVVGSGEEAKAMALRQQNAQGVGIMSQPCQAHAGEVTLTCAVLCSLLKGEDPLARWQGVGDPEGPGHVCDGLPMR